MLKRVMSTALVALVMLTLAPAGDAQAPIKIGVIQTLSGPVAESSNLARMSEEIDRE